MEGAPELVLLCTEDEAIPRATRRFVTEPRVRILGEPPATETPHIHVAGLHRSDHEERHSCVRPSWWYRPGAVTPDGSPPTAEPPGRP
jgi:hypothetical protein